MTLGILLSMAVAASYTLKTPFFTLFGRKTGITATRLSFVLWGVSCSLCWRGGGSACIPGISMPGIG